MQPAVSELPTLAVCSYAVVLGQNQSRGVYLHCEKMLICHACICVCTSAQRESILPSVRYALRKIGLWDG